METDLTVKGMVKFDGNGSLKAFCDVAIGELFLIRGFRVIEGKHGLFVSMPRQQGKDQRWYDHVSALTKEAKNEVGRVVMDAYQQAAVHDTRIAKT